MSGLSLNRDDYLAGKSNVITFISDYKSIAQVYGEHVGETIYASEPEQYFYVFWKINRQVIICGSTQYAKNSKDYLEKTDLYECFFSNFTLSKTTTDITEAVIYSEERIKTDFIYPIFINKTAAELVSILLDYTDKYI